MDGINYGISLFYTMRRFQRGIIEPLRLDYDDEDVFVDSSVGFQKSSSFQSMMESSREMSSSIHSEGAIDIIRGGQGVMESREDSPSPLTRQFSFGLHRRRSKKKDLRLR